MRIAVSGTHYSGKSTLVEDLAERLPKYAAIPEPYYQLEEEGYEFPEMPSIEDFEAQLRKSIQSLEQNRGCVIFDRCPVDFLAYALSVADSDSFNLEDWLPDVKEALKGLDLVVYLPADRGDPIPVPRSQDDDFRCEVDERIREFLVENSLGLEVEVIEVTGNPEARVNRVLQQLSRLG